MNKVHKFTLLGVIPSKKNSKQIWKRGAKSFINSSNRYLKWENEAILTLKSLNSADFIAISRCEIDFTLQFGDRRRRDLTNTLEGVLDALVSAGIIVDDNYNVVQKITARGAYNPAKEFICEIEITEI